MEEEKEDLIITSKRTFMVEVKTKQKYEFGGIVEGRGKAPTYMLDLVEQLLTFLKGQIDMLSNGKSFTPSCLNYLS